MKIKCYCRKINNYENGFSETVSSTEYTTSDGDVIYKHTITLTTPVTLEAGVTYALSVTLYAYSDNYVCYNDNTVLEGKSISSWATYNIDVGVYCQEWGTVSDIAHIELEYNT